jgi:UPF0042 nucleotide-binding protein
MEQIPATHELVKRVSELLDFLLPKYLDEGKSHLTIAIGCTGGRHRSVYVARKVFAHLQSAHGVRGIGLSLELRDAGR